MPTAWTARREADHGNGGHERHVDTGGNRLQDASGQQHPEAGRSQAYERTRKESSRPRSRRCLARSVWKSTRQRARQPEHEHVAGAQPLAKLHGNAHIRHNTHHHGVHGGLRQVTSTLRRTTSANNEYAARLSVAGKGPPFARRSSTAKRICRRTGRSCATDILQGMRS